MGELDATGHRAVYYELNGQPRQVRVRDLAATDIVAARERATKAPGSVGAPMPGSVVDVQVEEGDTVTKGDPLVVLSAMKMETVVASPVSGKVKRVVVEKSETLAAEISWSRNRGRERREGRLSRARRARARNSPRASSSLTEPARRE